MTHEPSARVARFFRGQATPTHVPHPLKRWRVIRTVHGGLAVTDAPTDRPILFEAYAAETCFGWLDVYEHKREKRRAIVAGVALAIAFGFVSWLAMGGAA